MERLSLSKYVQYSPTEASIHVARYLLAKRHVVGKRVLDIACGEGYGAFFMKSWGASSVHGIDISDEAVAAAQSQFSAPGISFDKFDATRIDEKFSAREFDVVVSLETIEHVDNPEVFLVALKKVAKPNAVFVISCPNDHWYYPDPSSENPFHKRKYSIGEFQALTSKVLGPDVQWLIGSAMIGFGTVELRSRSSSALGQAEMVEGTYAGDAAIVPAKPDEGFGPETCSYFVGVWGAQGTQLPSTAAFPISMTNYAMMMGAEVRIGVLQSELDHRANELRGRIEKTKEADSDLAALRLQLETTVRELEGRLAELRVERDRYRIKTIALEREWEVVGERLQVATTKLTTKEAQYQANARQMEADAQQLRNLLSSTQSERDHYGAQVESLERALEAAVWRTPKGIVRRAARGVKPMIPKAAMPLLIGIAKRLKF